MSIREAAVAGMFYPGNPALLQLHLDELFDALEPEADLHPQALVVPHAGYIYSGATAARAYIQVQPDDYEQILLLGPSHKVPLSGMALPTSQAFSTPLGDYPLLSTLLNELVEQELASFNDTAHLTEHSLEVQIPFLQKINANTPLVPVVVGRERPEQVSALIDYVSSRGKTLILVSSDLSHFHSYSEAQLIDQNTSQRIISLATDIKPEEACGCNALNGLLFWLKQQGKSIELIDQCNSGDTAGDKMRVVGYGAYGVYQ